MKNPFAVPLGASDVSNQPVKVQIARSRDDLFQAFQLTYLAYFKAGLSVDNPSGLRLTPYHLIPSSEVIVAKQSNVVLSTISIFGDGKLGLPMESMYSREIEVLRSRGLKLAEIGSLADHRSSPRRFVATLFEMGRLLAQMSTLRGIDALVAVVHPKHAKLYKRVLGFSQVGDHSDCPYANGNPAEALYLKFDEANAKLREQFFGEPLPINQLRPYEWDDHTRQYFARILDCDGKIANSVGIKNYHDWGFKRDKTILDLGASLQSPIS